MAKPPAKSDQDKVTEYIQQLDKDTSKIIEYLRKLILGVDKEIREHIKWNSPAFYYSGEMAPFDPKEYKRDLIVINLHRGKILLVFPTGARINDLHGILEGKYTDGRRLITIKDFADAKSKEKGLVDAIKDWLKTVEK